jgi:DNA-binding FrmR family transcriptional regulator
MLEKLVEKNKTCVKVTKRIYAVSSLKDNHPMKIFQLKVD